MPKVSVIVPNFNHALFLNQRIDSVLNQTYQDLELIILDDCSTDNSKEIIEQYRNNPKISYIVYNEINSGSTFKQWETGIGLAKGEFVWIAESDDWAEPNFLENLVKFIAKNDEIGFVYSDSNVFEAGVNVNTFSKINNTFTKTSKWDDTYVTDGHEELCLLSLFCSVNNASAVLFRRKALAQIFPLSYSLRFMGDWFIYIQLANRNKIGYLHLPLNNYRYHTANLSKDVNKNLGYVRERFIISNYLLKNCLFLSKDKLNKGLYDYAIHKVSLNRKSILVYRELALINFNLFCKLIWHSIFVLYKQKIKKIIR